MKSSKVYIKIDFYQIELPKIILDILKTLQKIYIKIHASNEKPETFTAAVYIIIFLFFFSRDLFLDSIYLISCCEKILLLLIVKKFVIIFSQI